MIFCTQCGAPVQDAHQYCWSCGAKTEEPQRLPMKLGSPVKFARVEARGAEPPRKFGQMFGLDPRIAFLTLIVDVMLNAGDLASMGLLFPVSALAGVVLGYITYRAQINWYGDDKESAKIKAIIVGLLTAIPTPLPELLYIPAGLVGLWHNFQGKISRGKTAGAAGEAPKLGRI